MNPLGLYPFPPMLATSEYIAFGRSRKTKRPCASVSMDWGRPVGGMGVGSGEATAVRRAPDAGDRAPASVTRPRINPVPVGPCAGGPCQPTVQEVASRANASDAPILVCLMLRARSASGKPVPGPAKAGPYRILPELW